MNYKYEEHLMLYQEKEKKLPTYNELYEYVKDAKEKAFKKGILIELFHRQIDDKDIHEIINSLKMSELELEQSQNDILKKHRFKEIDLSFKIIQDFFIELVKEYKKLGMKYCRDTILSK